MSVPNDVGNFADCLSNNIDVAIPMGILLGISLISNVYLCIKVSYSKKSSILEEEIELPTVFGSERNNSQDIELGNAKKTSENFIVGAGKKSSIPEWGEEEFIRTKT